MSAAAEIHILESSRAAGRSYGDMWLATSCLVSFVISSFPSLKTLLMGFLWIYSEVKFLLLLLSHALPCASLHHPWFIAMGGAKAQVEGD